MEQERNPVVKGLVDQLSSPEVQMLDALEAAYRLLSSEAAALYEAGANLQAAELDAAAEAIIIRIEEIAEEVITEGEGFFEGSDLELSGREREQVSLEDDLADAYNEYVGVMRGDPFWVARRRFENKKEFIALLRKIVHLHPSHGLPLAESITDKQLFTAAQDAHDASILRRRTLVAAK